MNGLKELLQKLEENKDLLTTLSGIKSSDDLLAKINELGFNITKEDISKVLAKIAELTGAKLDADGDGDVDAEDVKAGVKAGLKSALGNLFKK